MIATQAAVKGPLTRQPVMISRTSSVSVAAGTTGAGRKTCWNSPRGSR